MSQPRPLTGPLSTTLAAGPTPAVEEGKLIATLKSDAGLKEKMDACRQLAIYGSKDAVSVLASLLPDEKLSHMARYALEPLPDTSVDETLRAALGKVKGRQLVGVVVSIGVRRDAKAVEALIVMLDHTDTDVVGSAARSLSRIDSGTAGKLVNKLGSAPAVARPAIADGCINCAEDLLAQGKTADARKILRKVARADVPQHIKEAARAAAKKIGKKKK